MKALFVNLKNGNATIDSYRLPDALMTDLNDIIEQFGDANSETLTTSIEVWLRTEVKRILKDLERFDFGTDQTLTNYLLDDADFLERTMSLIESDQAKYSDNLMIQMMSSDSYAYRKFEEAIY